MSRILAAEAGDLFQGKKAANSFPEFAPQNIFA